MIKGFVAMALALQPCGSNLPPLRKGEVVVLNGPSWVIRVANKELIVDRVSVYGDKLDEFKIDGKTIRADKEFWNRSESEKRRLLANSRLSFKDGKVIFDGAEVDCSGRQVLALKGDAISLGGGIAVGVSLKEKDAYPGFIYLMYIDAESKKATFHEVMGNMSLLDFIFFNEE